MIDITLNKKTVLAPIPGLSSDLPRLSDAATFGQPGEVLRIYSAYKCGLVTWYEGEIIRGVVKHRGYAINAALTGQSGTEKLQRLVPNGW